MFSAHQMSRLDGNHAGSGCCCWWTGGRWESFKLQQKQGTLHICKSPWPLDIVDWVYIAICANRNTCFSFACAVCVCACASSFLFAITHYAPWSPFFVLHFSSFYNYWQQCTRVNRPPFWQYVFRPDMPYTCTSRCYVSHLPLFGIAFNAVSLRKASILWVSR